MSTARDSVDVAALLVELRRIADALERIATQPSGKLPARRRAQRRVTPVVAPAAEVDDITRAKARKALERVGLR